MDARPFAGGRRFLRLRIGVVLHEREVDLAVGHVARKMVARAPRLPRFVRDYQIVRVNPARFFAYAFEDVTLGNALQRNSWFILFMHRLRFHVLRVSD